MMIFYAVLYWTITVNKDASIAMHTANTRLFHVITVTPSTTLKWQSFSDRGVYNKENSAMRFWNLGDLLDKGFKAFEEFQGK